MNAEQSILSNIILCNHVLLVSQVFNSLSVSTVQQMTVITLNI